MTFFKHCIVSFVAKLAHKKIPCSVTIAHLSTDRKDCFQLAGVAGNPQDVLGLPGQEGEEVLVVPPPLQPVAVRGQAVEGFFIHHHFRGLLAGSFLFLIRFLCFFVVGSSSTLFYSVSSLLSTSALVVFFSGGSRFMSTL